ncbi:MAG: Gx transporter family protein [Christensenella sp.]|uniref:Gx transporter family protein n=1 Tax=Christensenella sp. TaxID=1935934 RepID=UPI002B218C11|nr:Gx transporter family protein [Christensenella sp.]MEA5002173.1 Gx transporter family protein [Christensenella sp.]
MASPGRTSKFILSAVLCGVALALSLVDGAISALLPLPGFKLGLANIVSLFALYYLGAPYAVLICIVRSLLAGIFSGNLTMLFFSLVGGLLSILIMYLFLKRLSLIKVSVLGGITHNLAQLMVAALLTATPQVSYYLPVLVLMGTVCGFCMGVLCRLVFSRLQRETVYEIQ